MLNLCSRNISHYFNVENSCAAYYLCVNRNNFLAGFFDESKVQKHLFKR